MKKNVEFSKVKKEDLLKHRKSLFEVQKESLESVNRVLSEDQKREIIKGYLGHFAVPIEPENLKLFKELVKIKKSYLIYGYPYNTLKEFAAFFLLHFSPLEFRKLNAFDILQNYFGELDETDQYSKCFYKIPEELAIIYIQRDLTPNKIFDVLLKQVLDYRLSENLLTLILSETRFNIFADCENFEIIDLMFKLGVDIKKLPKSNPTKISKKLNSVWWSDYDETKGSYY